ncbi:unnamed protein product [Trichobilharzia regenti]|nr:unnamed protein product [Trichobilharzia regenti]
MFGVLRRRYGRVVGEDFREDTKEDTSSSSSSYRLKTTTGKYSSRSKVNVGNTGGSVAIIGDDGTGENVEESTRKYSSRSKVNVVNTGGSVAIGDDGTGENVEESTSQFSRVQRYIREVRLRKGLPLNEQLVLNADKQRTLKKNK